MEHFSFDQEYVTINGDVGLNRFLKGILITDNLVSP
jgi:hypothetical protein